MTDINSVTLTGRLTRDPEMRTTAGGTQILTFGLAFNTSVRNKQTGEWEDRSNFIDCTIFGNRATALSRYLAKGNKVTVAGSLRYSSWERDGQRRSKLDLIVNQLEFMSTSRQTATQQPQTSSPAPQPEAPSIADFDEDIPF